MSILPSCVNRGKVYPESDQCECKSRFLVHSNRSENGIGLVTLDTCPVCPYIDRSNDQPYEPLKNQDNCKFRGSTYVKRECEVCGGHVRLVSVHDCNIKGECTTNNYGIRYGGLNTGSRIPACATCNTFVELDQPVSMSSSPKKKKKKRPLPARDNHYKLNIPNVVLTPEEKPADFLEGMYKGVGIFVLCGGPSLAREELQLLRRKGIVTASVNNAMVEFDWNTNIWITCDDQNRFSDTIWQDPNVMKFAKIKYLARYLKGNGPTGTYDKQIMPKDLANSWGYNHCAGWDENTFLTQDLPTWGTSRPDQDPEGSRHKSVMLIMIRLLFWLGFRRIYLLGCDWKMSQNNPYTFKETISPKSVRGNNELFRWLSNRFKDLVPHFKEHGLYITNCTTGGKLDVFPRMTLEAAVKEELSRIDFTLHSKTEGYYT